MPKSAAKNKPPILKFKRALTEELAEKAKGLFPDNKAVAQAIDESVKKQASEGGDDKSDSDADANGSD